VIRDRGEATVLMATVGAVATASPLIYARVTGAEDGLYRTAAFFAAVVAIGVGVGKVWGAVRRFLDLMEDLAELMREWKKLRREVRAIRRGQRAIAHALAAHGIDVDLSAENLGDLDEDDEDDVASSTP
jgi:Flp pilus assembly protein TadB